jgi:RNA polymerase sigma-70 factor (ECF subfamily)
MFITDAWNDLFRFVAWMAAMRRSSGGAPPSGGGGGGGREGGDPPDPEELFKEVYKAYFGRVHRFFVEKGFRGEDALDLTQDTFLRVYRYIGGFRGESNPGTWVHEIALSVWRNKIRERRARKRNIKEVSFGGLAENQQVEVPEDRLPEGWGGASPGALEQILADESKRALFEAMERLPPRMRRCLELRVHGGLKYREIAEIMKISSGTVKASISQAQKKLKEELELYFDFDLPGDPDGE